MKTLCNIKKRAFAMVLIMVLTLSNFAFAASDNTVNKIPTVMDQTWLEENDAPTLRIEESSIDEFNGNQKFNLKLVNAIWMENADSLLEGLIEDVHEEGLTYDISFKKLGDSIMEVRLTDFSNTQNEEAHFSIPLISKVLDSGEAKVVLDPLDSTLTGGTYTYAQITEPSMTVAIEDVRSFDNGEVVLAPIYIEEDVLGTWLAERRTSIEILGNGFEFLDSDVNITFTGGFSGNNPNDVSELDSETLLLQSISRLSNQRGGVIIDNLKIRALDNAVSGMLKLRISGSGLIDDYDIIVAEYEGQTTVSIETTATINKVSTVIPKHEFNKDGDFSVLKIQFNNNISIKNDQLFRLRLTNGTWNKDLENTIDDFVNDADIKRINNRVISVNWYKNVSDGYINIPLFCNVNTAGEAKIEILPLKSNISKDELVFANVIKPGTASKLEDTINLKFGNNVLPNLIIDEKAGNSIDEQIKIVLDPGYQWNNSGSVEFSGSLNGKTATQTIKGRTLTITMNKDSGTRSTLGTLTLTNAQIIPLNKTNSGDVNLTVLGRGITKEILEIVKYTKNTHGATIVSEGKVEILSGSQTIQNITITEELEHGLNLFGNKSLKLVLPKGFTWESAGKVASQGALTHTPLNAVVKGRTYTINSTFDYSSEAVGSLVISNAVIKASKKAPYGEVSLAINGKGINVQSLTVADYNEPIVEPPKTVGVTINSMGKVNILSGTQSIQNITITEDFEHGLKYFKNKSLKFILPKGFTWESAGDVISQGALADTPLKAVANGRTYTISSTFDYSSEQ